jgi:glycerol transport system ATP-binding protein
MASITLDNIGHAYDNVTPEGDWPLKPMTMEFKSGRTYALVGPSGCGKTTMLNIISGLVKPKQGRVLFDDRDVTSIQTEKRNVAQVFQFPAIYRSMNVFDNLAFPLVCRNWDKDKIKTRVHEVSEILGISDKLNRAATKLGVDEKQLVSLGRGLVRDDVSVLLMDEPLTVIDPQLKFLLRKRIKEANDELGSTIIYVTHDQYEAMTFAEELLVMSAGSVVQQGTPETLFERPVNNYVGYFIGSPAMNFINGVVSKGSLSVESDTVDTASPLTGVADGPVQLGIRPEYVQPASSTSKGVKVAIESIQDQGNTRVVTCRWGSQFIKMKVPREVSIPSSGSLTITLPKDKTLVYSGGDLVTA